ncbi:MAG: VWA domain-containing protein, partial [Gammaproteobacteria bacterium]|nr:VWA domain-containing protein [Gemmatimonadota bacterium]NIU78986.1 VWA domain-containing protein [Gammaproteobacteria bacterium]NIX24590.1 VWA domain-containing protein [Actinomycetota bacterium]
IRTLRRSLRTEGEPFERSWRRRRIEPRKLVFVLDVSGSMGAYARALARFAHAAVQAGRTVEVFAFGTRLTRITPALHSRDPDAALAALGGAVPDWEGGTRIGESLKTLVERWGRGGPIRGAVVVILSDGLDRGEPEVLATQMERLARLA